MIEKRMRLLPLLGEVSVHWHLTTPAFKSIPAGWRRYTEIP